MASTYVYSKDMMYHFYLKPRVMTSYDFLYFLLTLYAHKSGYDWTLGYKFKIISGPYYRRRGKSYIKK